MNVKLAGSLRVELSPLIDVAHADHLTERVRTHRTRVHSQRTADAAGNAFEKFQPGQPSAPRFDGNGLELCPRATVQMFANDLHSRKIFVPERNDNTANPAIANQ